MYGSQRGELSFSEDRHHRKKQSSPEELFPDPVETECVEDCSGYFSVTDLSLYIEEEHIIFFSLSFETV